MNFLSKLFGKKHELKPVEKQAIDLQAIDLQALFRKVVGPFTYKTVKVEEDRDALFNILTEMFYRPQLTIRIREFNKQLDSREILKTRINPLDNNDSLKHHCLHYIVSHSFYWFTDGHALYVCERPEEHDSEFTIYYGFVFSY